ncbi:MarR family winged helix-turn-helix transcriptional regulator [Deinococcus multiflagellatus]|uniref:MarR family winged helix-turn-helix transcriptional regulator n=1 Tax=Deinococcus multiflagellatus TaxID=1656887 RepID=A0ABW1ZNE1_9DEIO|nr:MarR family transcriptional regulator [Deinococcus multiflagellatus]MBZ9715185.1 MarR family transcriptional regulator [Deinococcus multiflagellatus]
MPTHPPTPPAVLEHQLYLALQVLGLRLKDDIEQLFKHEGLSTTQFNVLRILRGAGGQALTCGAIADQLLNRDPDVTRLLDRMEKQGLIERARSDQDRRVLLTRLSAHGRALVDRLDEPLLALHRQQFQALSPQQMEQLLSLLRQVTASSEVL